MKHSVSYRAIAIFACTAIVIAGCHNKSTLSGGIDNTTNKSTSAKYRVDIDNIPISNGVMDNTKYSKDSTFKYYYGAAIAAPQFDYSVDISNKSLVDLRLLKNEIYARHDYLFKDAILRGYFNQFKWYQPVFWDTAFKFSLGVEEVQFISKVDLRYNTLLQQNYLTKDGKKFANMGNIMNLIQFKDVPDILMQHINKDGFAIAPAKNEQLFHVYDQNQYDAIPNFVTSDVYLQLLYLHFKNILKEIEEEKFVPAMDAIMKSLYNQSASQAKSSNPGVQKAASFNTAYYAVCNYLLNEEIFAVPADKKAAFDEVLEKVKSGGYRCALINDPIYDFSQLKPRGHYTSNDTLKGYFKCLKWLMTTPHFMNDPEKLSAIVLTAWNLNKLKSEKGESISGLYKSINETIGLIVGSPDNLSLADVTGVLQQQGLLDKSPEEILSADNLNKIKAKLLPMDPERIHSHGIDDTTQKVINQSAVYFMPSRYTFDAEILQRLIQVLAPEPLRPFPKGLDIFAAMGDKAAEDILMNTYKENEKWTGYKDTLQTLKSKFANFKGYDDNDYGKMMQTILTLQDISDSSPYYMHSNAWGKRVLNTSLAAWTELKHSVVLYAKQPNGAEAGEGGGPPPPIYPGYVEPNVAFWRNCLSLLDLTTKNLQNNNLITEHYTQVNKELKNLATFCLGISEKELKGENVTEKELNDIMYIGGRIEYLSQELIYSDIPLDQEDDPDRCIGIATDVYTYRDKCLEEATGLGNEIYVVAEINGFLYVTRGAVFSYYEFQQPSSDRLTDEEWQSKLGKNNIPPIPVWMNDLMVPVKHLETKSFFTYSANPSSLIGQ